MDRRRFLATALALPAAASGCLGTNTTCDGEGDWAPTVRVEEVALRPGETSTLEIHVEDVTAFHFNQSRLYSGLDPEDVSIVIGESISPSPAYQVDSYPPTWVWDSCTAVDISNTVRAAPATPPGEYEYGFRISEDIGDRHAQQYRYTITVSEG